MEAGDHDGAAFCVAVQPLRRAGDEVAVLRRHPQAVADQEAVEALRFGVGERVAVFRGRPEGRFAPDVAAHIDLRGCFGGCPFGEEVVLHVGDDGVGRDARAVRVVGDHDAARVGKRADETGESGAGAELEDGFTADVEWVLRVGFVAAGRLDQVGGHDGRVPEVVCEEAAAFFDVWMCGYA